MSRIWIASIAAISLAPGLLLAQGKGKVVEEIIARVNNEIITLSDYKKAEATLKEEVAQDCQNCPQDRLDSLLKDREKNLLRDLIDQSLLAQRGKDDDVSVESEVVKRLDEVRQQNNLPSLEELEKAVESQGISWEDYKSGIRNQLLTQEVVHREVGPRITIGHDEVKKYYGEHQNDFVRPENVLLAEISLNTDGKTPDEVAAIKKKADDLRDRLKKGDDFTELAKRYSEGPTAKQGGELGSFEHGQLSKQIEEVVFKMNRGDLTEVIQTKTGFEILKLVQHFQAGLQPIDKVENEIMNRLYMDRMQPVLRNFLAELREQSYVIVKPGYVDSAAVAGGSVIQETAPTPDAKDKKLSKKAKRAT
jgi:peptidyl-prolyl cis-trans isomerase SurA